VQHLNDLNTTLGAGGGCQQPAQDAAECLLSFCFRLIVFCFRLINDEWFRIWIIFKDGVIAGGYACGILDCSPQFKTDAVPALPAQRKTSIFQQGGFVHQPMRRMCDPVNSTLRNQISRLVFPLHPSVLDLALSPQFWRLANTKRLLILLTRPTRRLALGLPGVF
jgi:hypothetical protein